MANSRTATVDRAARSSRRWIGSGGAGRLTAPSGIAWPCSSSETTPRSGHTDRAEVSKHVTMVEMDDPPGYFRMARTGRVHLVRRVTRVTWRSGETHRSVEFWCANLSGDERGELLTVMPPDALACVGCRQTRYRGLPHVRA